LHKFLWPHFTSRSVSKSFIFNSSTCNTPHIQISRMAQILANRQIDLDTKHIDG
jgi:hypothetical protein